MLTGLDDEHLGVAAVAAGAQDYLVKGKVDGQVLIRAVRYAVERRRAEASLLRLREEELAAAESARLERGLLPSPLLAGSPVRARSFYRAGRARSLIGGDFFDAVLGPTGTVHAIVGDVCGHGPDEAALGALLRVSWRALVLAGVGRAAAAAQAAAGAGQRAARPGPVHHGLHGGDPGRRRRSAGGAGAAGRAPAARLCCDAEPRAVEPPVGAAAGRRCRMPTWEPLTVPLDPGWALLPYTDGLIEGRGPEPGEPLWEEGLLDVLAQERDTDLELLPARLVERAQELNGGPLVDDVAILLLSADADLRRRRRRRPGTSGAAP